MREFLDDIFKNNPLDPMESARRNMRPDLHKRFYNSCSVQPVADGFQILLDDRQVKTPARRPLAVPSQPLAQAIADEWAAQKDVIDPRTMPLTRLANSIIDGVVDAPVPVREEIMRYLGSDLLFYRADGPEGLTQEQERHWDPVVAWARDALGARFILMEGVVFAPQPDQAIEAAARAIPDNPWALGAVHSAMTLTGSALLALALAAGNIDLDTAWRAAHVDEDWNIRTWGEDEIVLERRASRFADMAAAAQVLQLVR